MDASRERRIMNIVFWTAWVMSASALGFAAKVAIGAEQCSPPVIERSNTAISR